MWERGMLRALTSAWRLDLFLLFSFGAHIFSFDSPALFLFPFLSLRYSNAITFVSRSFFPVHVNDPFLYHRNEERIKVVTACGPDDRSLSSPSLILLSPPILSPLMNTYFSQSCLASSR